MNFSFRIVFKPRLTYNFGSWTCLSVNALDSSFVYIRVQTNQPMHAYNSESNTDHCFVTLTRSLNFPLQIKLAVIHIIILKLINWIRSSTGTVFIVSRMTISATDYHTYFIKSWTTLKSGRKGGGCPLTKVPHHACQHLPI